MKRKLPAGSSSLASIAIIMHFMSLNQAMNFQFNAAFSFSFNAAFINITQRFDIIGNAGERRTMDGRKRGRKICYDIA